MGKKRVLFLADKSTDSNFVISGVFKFYSTYGIPLNMIIDFFQKNGMLIDWVSFISDALKFDMKPRSLHT